MSQQSRILVIDDEDGICRGIKRSLEPEGYQVKVCHDGQQGLDYIREKEIDLALIDVKIPGISGLDLIGLIHDMDPEIICIIITGYATIEMAVSAIKQGAYDFLTKPFSVDVLLLAVNQGLERRMLSLEAKRAVRAEEEARRLACEKERLEDLNQAKKEFIRLVTHELQSPVSAVENYIKLILQGYVPPDEEEKILRKCISRTEEERGLIADLLELGHLEIIDSYQIESVSFAEVINRIVEEFEEETAEKKLTLSVDLGENIPVVRMAPEQSRSLWSNLICNAVKYTPEGGEVHISFKKIEDRLLGEVRDTGIGIPEEDQENLFTEFFRAKNARESGIPGTGLGLVIARRIVEGLGGELTVKSELGEGTTFKFWIPVNSC